MNDVNESGIPCIHVYSQWDRLPFCRGSSSSSHYIFSLFAPLRISLSFSHLVIAQSNPAGTRVLGIWRYACQYMVDVVVSQSQTHLLRGISLTCGGSEYKSTVENWLYVCVNYTSEIICCCKELACIFPSSEQWICLNQTIWGAIWCIFMWVLSDTDIYRGIHADTPSVILSAAK